MGPKTVNRVFVNSLTLEIFTLSTYPEILCEVLSSMFTVEENRNTLIEEALVKLKEKGIGLTQAVVDLWKMLK